AHGTLQTGNNAALGSAVGNTVISNGATLDVNGRNLTTEPIVVLGPGVNNAGAIINTGADQLNALINVTITGDTTFGGSTRWDIRGTGATLSTGGNGYNLTKTGANQISLVGVNVDGALNN